MVSCASPGVIARDLEHGPHGTDRVTECPIWSPEDLGLSRSWSGQADQPLNVG